MRELSYSPKPKNKNARYVCAAFLGSAILSVALYMLVYSYRTLISILIGAFIVAAVFVYSKHVAAIYYYDITCEDGGRDLVIRQVIGKRQLTLCRVDVASIREVRFMNATERKAYKPEKNTAVYSYHPTLMPPSVYLVSVRSDAERADVFIEADEAFASALVRYAGFSDAV